MDPTRGLLTLLGLLEVAGLPAEEPLDEESLDWVLRELQQRLNGGLAAEMMRAGVSNPGEAAAVRQDTWIKVWRFLGGLNIAELRERFSTDTAFDAYIRRIARNVCHDHRRALERQPVSLEGILEQGSPFIDGEVVRGGAVTSGGDRTGFPEILERLVQVVKDSLCLNVSPQGRATLPRVLALLELDVRWYWETGTWPSYDDVRKILGGFPNPSAVSVARAVYRERLKKLFPGGSAEFLEA